MHGTPLPPLETQRLRKLAPLLKFWVPLAAGPAVEQKLNETKDSPPGPPPGGSGASPSPDKQFPPSLGRPLRASCTCRRVWRGLDGWASCLWPAPWRRTWKAAAAAWEWGRPQGGAHGDEQAEGCSRSGSSSGFLRRMMCLIASVCFCAAETAGHSSRQRLRKGRSMTREHSELYLLLLLHVSETQPRWRSWTTSWTSHDPDCAVTFVTRSARSVAARSSCRTARSCPPSCRSLSALAWWTCSNAMACRAEAASPQAL